MPIVSRNENPFPDLVEVKASLVSARETNDAYDLCVELRVHPCEIEEEIGTILVEVLEATLALDTSGVQIVPKTKYGQPVLSAIIHKEIDFEETTSISADTETAQAFKGSGSMSLSATGPKLGGNAENKREAKEKSSSGATLKKSTTEERDFHRFKAVGDDKWKLSEEKKTPLDGVFINHEPLCKLSVIPGSNSIYTRTELIVKQRHMNVELTVARKVSRLFKTDNQSKLAAIIMKKSINNRISPAGPFDGTLVFSVTENSNEE